MKILLQLLCMLALHSCISDGPKDFIYSKGQDWTVEFQNNSLPSKTLYKDKVYCSSLRVGKENYLYCLNLKTGKVDWATEVKNWATNPPIVNDSLIYYCSYTGDLYRLNLDGQVLWNKGSKGVLESFCINPWNGNLMVTTIASGLFEYNVANGDLAKRYATNSLAITSPVFLENNMLIAGVKPENDTVSLKGDLLVYYDSKGNKEFEVNIGKVESIHLDNNRLFYLQTDSSRLFCFDLRNRTTEWQSHKLLDIESDNMFFTNNHIYCYGHNLNRIYEVDKQNGDIIRVVSYHELVNEMKIVQNVYSYKVATGNRIKEIKITDSLESPIRMHSELNIHLQ